VFTNVVCSVANNASVLTATWDSAPTTHGRRAGHAPHGAVVGEATIAFTHRPLTFDCICCAAHADTASPVSATPPELLQRSGWGVNYLGPMEPEAVLVRERIERKSMPRLFAKSEIVDRWHLVDAEGSTHCNRPLGGGEPRMPWAETLAEKRCARCSAVLSWEPAENQTGRDCEDGGGRHGLGRN
jgi:hypothetical protein